MTGHHRDLHFFPNRRPSDLRSFGMPSGMSIISLNTWPHAARRFCSLLSLAEKVGQARKMATIETPIFLMPRLPNISSIHHVKSEEHTPELQPPLNLLSRLLL